MEEITEDKKIWSPGRKPGSKNLTSPEDATSVSHRNTSRNTFDTRAVVRPNKRATKKQNAIIAKKYGKRLAVPRLKFTGIN